MAKPNSVYNDFYLNKAESMDNLGDSLKDPECHFLEWGSYLPKFGDRCLMVKSEYMMDGWLAKGTYLGEWSTETQKPHGRGVLYSHKSYTIMINYWNNGKPADGKYVLLNAYEHWLEVGEQKRDPRA